MNGDVPCNVMSVSPSKSFQMLSRSSRRFLTFSTFSIISTSMPISTNLASINCPFNVAPRLSGFAALWWSFYAIVLISSIVSSLNFLMKVLPLAASKIYLS